MLLKTSYPPANRGKVVVWGLLASYPFGGMAWQVLHYVAGLRRLGFDVWYVEDSDRCLLDIQTYCKTTEWSRNVDFMIRQLGSVGLADRWMFRPPGDPDKVLGGSKFTLQNLYGEADAVFNLCACQELRPEHDVIRCLVLVETDPGEIQVAVANGDRRLCDELDRYHHLFTYGENLGEPDCRIPAERYTWHKTRPPVVVDWWETEDLPPSGTPFTTVANWKHSGRDLVWNGELWRWSKHHAFQKVMDLASRSPLPMEMALGAIGEDEIVKLRSRRWRIRNSEDLSDPDAYRRYIQNSLGEFTVAKEQYVRPVSGWFSDRSVCYLAAGRPVITQDTGFAKKIPTGTGLFAFRTQDEALSALETVAADYHHHAKAAQKIAHEYFGAERVLSKMLETAGLL